MRQGRRRARRTSGSEGRDEVLGVTCGRLPWTVSEEEKRERVGPNLAALTGEGSGRLCDSNELRSRRCIDGG